MGSGIWAAASGLKRHFTRFRVSLSHSSQSHTAIDRKEQKISSVLRSFANHFASLPSHLFHASSIISSQSLSSVFTFRSCCSLLLHRWRPPQRPREVAQRLYSCRGQEVAPMEDTQEIEEQVQEEVNLDNAPEKKQETRNEILSRHRKEISQLQTKEVEMKKAAARGSKAEQKAKKKQVEEEVSRLSAKLKEKHAKELAALGYSGGNGNEKGNLDNLVKAIAGVSVSSQPDRSRVSKAQQKRDRRAQQEAEREQRIQAEQIDTISDRTIENEKLEKKLKPLGLTVCEIKPDGHCLYRAVEDQLAHLSGGRSPHTYQELREMAAAYMRKHPAEFLPFFPTENLIGDDSDETLSQKFENYCKEVESTAVWGGELELRALAHCLKKHIMIFSGSFRVVDMGEEYKSDDATGSCSSSIMLSYHKHAFGLGEHYNSVVPT